MEPVFFANQFEFRKWLEHNYYKETELLVGYYKVNSGKQNMTWSQSVDQALCFGWIDGIRRSIDEYSYSIRFTPRRPNSKWSSVNLKKVESLLQQNLMHPSGIKSYASRKVEHSGTYSYEKNPGKLPADFESPFKANKKAWAFFNAQAPSYRKTVIRWIMDAKQESTRQRRLEKTITQSEAGRKIY